MLKYTIILLSLIVTVVFIGIASAIPPGKTSEFEGGGQNIDIVSLRSGDKLSGVIETPIITVLISSGKEINLDKEKIKKITLKK